MGVVVHVGIIANTKRPRQSLSYLSCLRNAGSPSSKD